MTTLFYMWGPFRDSLIESHLFYVKQAKVRLLSQFDNLSIEAEKYAEEWLKERSPYFNPDIHDPSDFDEHAYDASIEFYQMLSDMRNRTLLSIMAGLFHEWDKQLRDWLVKEVNHWHSGEAVKKAIWKANFEEVFDFIDKVIVEVKSQNFYQPLDKCRLLVNAYKHGEGDSFQNLKSKYPEFLDSLMVGDFFVNFSDYTDIVVNDTHVDEFSNAIVEFWKIIPQYVYSDKDIEFPDWFKKAYIKDKQPA